MKAGDIVDYGSIICKITAINNKSIIIRSENGNIYKVKPCDVVKTTKLFKL